MHEFSPREGRLGRAEGISWLFHQVGTSPEFVRVASRLQELESLVFDRLANPAHQGDSLELGE